MAEVYLRDEASIAEVATVKRFALESVSSPCRAVI
jgi:hypothetical protein